MSADRELFNRRDLRQKTGTRTNRRRNTKSPAKQRKYNHKTKRHETELVLRPRPAARVNEMIEQIKREAESG